ncbi:M48 family metallopeptidase [Cyanobacterium stanieri LEGE 03274]|uniref:M48 family metallopeptidase n=1 Tax=Cyanobacterium stanieri LEGE 03274 TaxID=1828756 RepID=A0ABR9V6J1_9CHRO|nr:M48 family metallopeptidase [Cyanobacterium stanieri]MBE9223149.1 M48 family metallopeptidase [Cyanobacterium stanieri LEGE 03274]
MPYSSPIRDRNSDTNNRQVIIVLIIFLTVISLIIYGLFAVINNVVNFIPISVEQRIGSLVVPSFERKNLANITNQQLNQLLDNLENKLPENSLVKRDYEIIYVPENVVNAIALPGNKIVIYEGLLKEVESENELMMILGHEIGHFANRDHLRSIGHLILIRIVINYFLGGSEILQSGADLSNLIVNARYSQNQEQKADLFGINLLNKYYDHVNGATDFFQRLNEEAKNNLNIAFLSSHPLPEKRVRRLEKLIKENNYSIKDKTALNITIER